jgi:hypothetical protein
LSIQPFKYRFEKTFINVTDLKCKVAKKRGPLSCQRDGHQPLNVASKRFYSLLNPSTGEVLGAFMPQTPRLF